MDILLNMLENKMLLAAISGWFIAQVLKTIIYLITNKEFNPERLVGDGGMPSAHSATVSAMATAAGFLYGWDSPIFAISTILAIIVMHDAMGVRRETGRQAQVINQILELFKHDDTLNIEQRLKIFVGHTPLQVFVGCLLGISIGTAFCFIF